MINLIKQIKKCTIIITLSLIVMCFPIFAKAAEETNDVKNQFMSLGGSENGYKTILQIVEKSRMNSDTLSSQIKEKYNQKLFEAMVANSFDERMYSKIYYDMQKEKKDLLSKNLDDMVNLLKKLSLADRKAYAQLLYGIDRVMPNDAQSTDEEDVRKNTINDGDISDEKINNSNAENSSTTDTNVASVESKVENNIKYPTNKSDIGNTNLLNQSNN